MIFCVLLPLAAGILSRGTEWDVEWNGKRWGDNIQRRRIGSPRYGMHLPCMFFFVFFTLLPSVYDGMAQFYSLSQDDTWARDRVRVLICQLEKNVRISFGYFRGLHRLLWNTEKGWIQRQREEGGGGDVDICTSLHHWDLGLGAAARWEGYLSKAKMCQATKCVPLLRRFPVFLLWLVLFYTSLFPSRVINTMLAADGFTTPKCCLDAAILSISTHGEPLCLSVSRLSGHAEVCMFSWHVRCGNSEMTTRLLKRLSGYFYHSECNIGRT